MNTQPFSQAFGGLGAGASLGLSFQDFPASQDNYLEFTEFSQVGGSGQAVGCCLSNCHAFFLARWLASGHGCCCR